MQLGVIKQILMQIKDGSNLLILLSELFHKRRKELSSSFGGTLLNRNLGDCLISFNFTDLFQR